MIETAARAEQPEQDAQEERDYQAFCATLAGSERGRAFLAEYTRRNRNADTKLLLAAIDKLQALIVANRPLLTVEPVKTELLALLGEIGAAQSELEASVVSMRAAKLGELITLVERRITSIVGSPAAMPSLERDSAESDTSTLAESTHLAVVPLPDQPELPIPSPITTTPPSIALVHSEAIIAEVAFVEPAPARIDQQQVVVEMPGVEPAIGPVLQAALVSKARPTGPLASIMALSEEERLALFT